jgi:tetratricopeptide (TPR) repeat protein
MMAPKFMQAGSPEPLMFTRPQLQALVLLVLSAGGLSGQISELPAGKTTPQAAPLHGQSVTSSNEGVRDTVMDGVCRVKELLYLTEGYELVAAGRFAEGEASFRLALDTVERGGPGDAVTRACLINLIGFAALQQRSFQIAAGWFERGLDLRPLPDALAVRLTSNLAIASFDLQQFDRAEKLARRAASIASQAFGSDDPEMLVPLATLASVYFARGNHARAEPRLRRVLYQMEKASGAASYETSSAAGNLAMLYLHQRRYNEAKALLEKSLAVRVARSQFPDITGVDLARGRQRSNERALSRLQATAPERINDAIGIHAPPLTLADSLLVVIGANFRVAENNRTGTPAKIWECHEHSAVLGRLHIRAARIIRKGSPASIQVPGALASDFHRATALPGTLPLPPRGSRDRVARGQ